MQDRVLSEPVWEFLKSTVPNYVQGDMIPKARTPGRPKSIAGTFASSVRNDDPDVTKAQIDKKRREKKKREKWVTVGKEMKIQLNVDLLARYHDMCENVDNNLVQLLL